MKRIKRLLFILTLMIVMSSGTMAASAAFGNVRIPAIKPGEPITPVKTLQWNALLKVRVKTPYGRFRKGTRVLATKVTKTKCIIVLANHKYNIARKYLFLTGAIVTSRTEGDYNTSTKIDYANKKERKSSTKYLIWVSLDKQRVNVYTGASRKWKLIRVMKCSTGVGASTPIGKFRILNKARWYAGTVNFLNFSGSGFHAWPSEYPDPNGTLGKKVASHGCIRLAMDDSEWMFQYIPVGTTVYIF